VLVSLLEDNDEPNTKSNKTPTQVEDQDDVIYTADDKKSQLLIQSKNEESPSLNDLHSNDSRILSFLHQENRSNQYTFKGLMRKLSLHQQSLTRALHRLEDLGLVERSDAGYKLSKNGKAVHIPKGLRDSKAGKNEFLPLLHTYLPINIRIEEVLLGLMGKWFGKLRWSGVAESESGHILQWINDDNTLQINLKISSKYVTVESNARSDKEKIEAMMGAQRIFEQLTIIMQEKLDLDILPRTNAVTNQNN